MSASRRHVFGGTTAFETPLGLSYLSWTKRGVSDLRLPDPVDGLVRAAQGLVRAIESDLPAKARTEESGSGMRPEAGAFVSVNRTPPWVAYLCERIIGHLEGRHDDFLDVPLDLPEEASSFDRDVWTAAREVPAGLTITYGELAEEAGRPGAARAAGSALRRCPIALLIPAHRVISANRRPGGWTGGSGVPTKLMLLSMEGVVLPGFGAG